MKIGILGTRGIPANYGGFETFAEECGAGLAARGHQVTVYCRSHYVPRGLRRHRDVDLVVLPTLPWKYTDTVVHTFFSVLHALFRRFDVILICNAANSIYAWIPRMFGVPVAVNVDGIERLRHKWNLLGKGYYLVSEYFSVWFPTAIVTDARVIERYYRMRYGASSIFIPYGALTEKPGTRAALDALGLEPGGYFLYVSRLEPENNADRVIRAFEKVRTSRRLVVVGDAPYARAYIQRLKSTQDERVLFPGAVYAQGYRELQANACCYIHATEVGGTHPALIEAMGLGNVVVANGTPENAEVLADAGILYRKNDDNDLARILQEINDDPGKYLPFKLAARARVEAEYLWQDVVIRYEQLFAGLAGDTRPPTSDLRPPTSDIRQTSKGDPGSGAGRRSEV
jgi:glycosyltransferase involved in cell wall biosynthesis